MELKDILFEEHDGVALMTLNRPDAMNSLSEQMIVDFDQALSHIRASQSIRALAITGSGQAFCAGADLKGVLKGVLSGDPAQLLDFVNRIQEQFQAIRELPIPTIAAINGIALAGGLELVLACDVVFAAESARIGDAHSNFAVLPGAGGGTLLPRVIGEKKANYLLYSGDNLPAAEWEKMGLVSRITADDALIDEVMKCAGNLAKKSPLVLASMKRMVSESRAMSVIEALQFERVLLVEHSQTADMLEGLSAFSEKRKPVYTGK